MQRITKVDLQNIVFRINKHMGKPIEPYSKVQGKFIANIGNYHLDSAYGGHQLVQMQSEGGGISVVLGGYVSKRVIYERMHAFLKGLQENDSRT